MCQFRFSQFTFVEMASDKFASSANILLLCLRRRVAVQPARLRPRIKLNIAQRSRSRGEWGGVFSRALLVGKVIDIHRHKRSKATCFLHFRDTFVAQMPLEGEIDYRVYIRIITCIHSVHIPQTDGRSIPFPVHFRLQLNW